MSSLSFLGNIDLNSFKFSTVNPLMSTLNVVLEHLPHGDEISRLSTVTPGTLDVMEVDGSSLEYSLCLSTVPIVRP